MTDMTLAAAERVASAGAGASGGACQCPRCLDFHAHFLQRDVFESARPHSVSSCFGAVHRSADTPAYRRMFEPELQVADMVARGVDVHLLSSADVIQGRSWATPRDEARLAAMVNDECARWVDRHPDHFIGSAVLPLGDMALLAAELDRVAPMKLKVVTVPSNYRGVYLGEDHFRPFWEMVHDRGLIVFIHPDGTTDRWFQKYALWNSIGQSIEEVKVMSSLIYEGVLDRHPGVKIVMAHGGGYMPYYMGRLDRNVSDKPDTAKNLSKLPSQYLTDFYYDTCVYDPKALVALIDRVGADRIVLGGDYPVAAVDPLQFIDSAGLSDEQRAMIAGGTASSLLGLS